MSDLSEALAAAEKRINERWPNGCPDDHLAMIIVQEELRKRTPTPSSSS